MRRPSLVQGCQQKSLLITPVRSTNNFVSIDLNSFCMKSVLTMEMKELLEWIHSENRRLKNHFNETDQEK